MSSIKKNDERGRPSDWRGRKQQVLTRSAPSQAQSIAHALILKDEALYLVTERDGLVPFQGAHGFGAYHHDCRFLNGYSLAICGAGMELLGANMISGHEAIFELTNPELALPNGQTIEKHDIGLRLRRSVDGRAIALEDNLTLRSYAREQTLDIELELAFRADFEDIYIIRGLGPDVRGEVLAPAWRENELILSYHGKDGVARTSAISFSLPPDSTADARATFTLRLAPGEAKILKVQVVFSEHPQGSRRSSAKPDAEGARQRVAKHKAAFRDTRAHIETDNSDLDLILEQSFTDLLTLRTPLNGDSYFAAGVPWFTTLFGRDSLITALFFLPYEAAIAEETLRLLAKHQGREVDAWRDEAPGKILHELRVGELANLGEIPDTPYYGTIDATALFLILLGRHAAWTGRLDLFRDLRANVDAALEWISKSSEHPGLEGYVAYDAEKDDLLVNQGWKDSGDAIVDEDGHIAAPPIALVEVQGYTYLAKTEIAKLFERDGKPDAAEKLRREAEDLKARFNRDFWAPERGTYALALTSGGKPARVTSSNPGHALFAGIADEEKARKTAASFMSEAMFSGWGVRTLAASEKAYHPISYHRGTVWPHDNALIVAGLRRYGFDVEAQRVTSGIVEAATHFPLRRLPEVFSGFPRAGYGTPIRYPVACHPQAWASGSIPFMITSLLGLEPNGFEGRVHIQRPVLPPHVKKLSLLGLAVGAGRADIAFQRMDNGRTDVSVLRTEGDIEIVRDEEPSSG